jgi:hypothetical protein
MSRHLGSDLLLLVWFSMMTRRGIMKLLLTSAGISNTSIHDALIDLLGKPIAECSNPMPYNPSPA